MDELEIRQVEFEARFDVETREVTGLAVPYGQVISIGGFQERIQQGAFGSDNETPLFWGHDHKSVPIGRAFTTDGEAGLSIRAKLNNTALANDVYEALKAGDVSKFSVGFKPVSNRREGDVIVREKATLKEVSIVNFPAYSEAGVESVRNADEERKETHSMEKNEIDYASEIGELRDNVADLGRKFDRVSESEKTESYEQYRTGGQFLKALAKGEQNAETIFTRDFATSVDADNIRPTWMNKNLRLIDKQRVVKGLFDTEPLPATGNSVEYPFVKSQTGTVGVQANEGDNLSYLELAIDTATAPVKTVGGYSSLSRQAIERSDVAYLDAVMRFQAIAYANETERLTQVALLAASGVNTVELGGATGSTKTAAQWIEAILDAKAAIDDNSTLGLSADFVLISRDVQKKLALIVDTTGRPVFDVNNDGANTFGSLPLNGRLAGVIDGTPLVVGKNLSAGTVLVASSSALVTLESPGAPFRLADENVVNLTKDFSLYGYFAVEVPDAKAITKIVDAA